ncbi:TldD/PmbA family protein [bacterium]|nr:TldD/PmbA family protein [bacterium]
MVERILELAAARSEGAEVVLEESESRPIQFENNQLKYVHTKARRGVSLRLIQDGRLGFASTTDPEQVERLVDAALESARYGQEAKFVFPGQPVCEAVAVFDPAVADFPVARGIEIGKDAIDQVRTAFDDVLCSIEIGKVVSRVHMMNTSGLDVEQRTTNFDAYLTGVRVRNGGILWVSEGQSSRALAADMDGSIAKVIHDVRASERECDVASGDLPVLFSAGAMELLVQIFQTGVNGKLVQKGASPLVGKLGEKLLDERVTLSDDATRDWGESSSVCDGEGVASRRVPLFEAGVLKAFLYDLQTAGLVGAESTGSAARSFASQPGPDASNLALEPGDASFAEMLGGIERGLLVEDVLGGGQSNVLAGEFSVNVGLGFLVEKGQIVGRVKDCMLAGNVFDVFKRIRAIGSELKIHGSLVSPAVCFDAMSVSGTG